MGRFVFKLPDVGEGVAEAEIVAWHVSLGDAVVQDAPLVDVMTDKATVEITSPVAGRILEISGEPGALAAIGSVLVVFDVEAVEGVREANEVGESEGREDEGRAALSATPPSWRSEPEADALVAEPARGSPPPDVAPGAARTSGSLGVPQRPGVRPLASPAVRRQALNLGVPLQFVPGSGPAGRITRADLEAFAAQPSPAGRSAGLVQRNGAQTVKMIGLRRQIAERMSEAKRRIPHFSYIEEVDVTDLERLRGELNLLHRDRPRLTVLPFLLRALAHALVDFPQINATFDDEAGVVTRHAPLHLGIATQTPGGLVVPVVRHAEALDLWSAAAEIARLAEAARRGAATREELTGSTITITSLGPLGGLATTPVINRPEVAIIGPNRIVERPVIQGGAITVRKMMNLSSSFDHRVVDGWDAAEFVQRLKRLLETPALLFVES